MRGRLHDLSVSRDGEWLLTIKTRENVGGLFDELHDTDVDVTVKKWRDKRSKDANAYFWCLCGKLADKLYPLTKNDIYLKYVRQIGPYKDYDLTEEQAKTFRVVWEHMGVGWPTEQVDFTPDGERLVIRAYYGSSVYNTKRMSRLIDLAVQDCREQGIETLPPHELDALISRWGEVAQCH